MDSLTYLFIGFLLAPCIILFMTFVLDNVLVKPQRASIRPTIKTGHVFVSDLEIKEENGMLGALTKKGFPAEAFYLPNYSVQTTRVSGAKNGFHVVWSRK